MEWLDENDATSLSLGRLSTQRSEQIEKVADFVNSLLYEANYSRSSTTKKKALARPLYIPLATQADWL